MTERTPPTRAHLVAIVSAALGVIPAVLLAFGVVRAPVGVATVVFGVGILSAAFLLSWAAEAAQVDISQGLAIAFLAFIAVLPEYAVDLVFAWKAGRQDAADGALPGLCGPEERCSQLAIANMTGANRLLIGLGWAVVVLIWYARSGKKGVELPVGRRTDLGVMFLATAWALKIVVLARIDLVDTIVLLVLFGWYLWHALVEESEEPELVGPPIVLGSLPTARRRIATAVMFLYAAGAIVVSAEPFADGLVTVGASFGIDTFLLVQWLAPLASEAPEMIIAILFVLRAKPHHGLGALISSKVNQWTLLVGTIPVVYAIAYGAIAPLPLGSRQVEELLLTATQSLFASAVLANLVIGRWEAAGLLALFLAQFGFQEPAIRYGFAIAYLTLFAVLVVTSRSNRRGLVSAVRHVFSMPGSRAGLDD